MDDSCQHAMDCISEWEYRNSLGAGWPCRTALLRLAPRNCAGQGRMRVMDLTVRSLTAERWPALEDLFGRARAPNGGWGMYGGIGPRYRERPREDNKRDLERLAQSGPAP